jgi:hypothetical protein
MRQGTLLFSIRITIHNTINSDIKHHNTTKSIDWGMYSDNEINTWTPEIDNTYIIILLRMCRNGVPKYRQNNTSPLDTCTGFWQKYFTFTENWAYVNRNELHLLLGRAIAQAVSRRLPAAAVRVRAQVRSCRICGGQSGSGAGFIRVLRFPLPILIPSTAPHSSSSIILGWYNRPISGWHAKWTQSRPTPRN